MCPVPIGLKNLYYALLTTDVALDGLTPASVTYGAPARIIGAVSANINPNPSSETFFADDGPMDTASALGQIELELSVADLTLAVQAILLGHAAPVAGRIYRKAEDVAPWVAVGFQALKSDGTYRFTWLLKGKFQQNEQNAETKGDTINFQPPTITSQFVRRDCDDAWILQGDEEDVLFVPSSWFAVGTLQVLAPSNTTATVVSSEYTVDDTAETITAVPASTDVATVEGNIYTSHPDATFDIFEADGTTARVGNVISTDKLIATAVDTTTTKTYVITVT